MELENTGSNCDEVGTSISQKLQRPKLQLKRVQFPMAIGDLES